MASLWVNNDYVDTMKNFRYKRRKRFTHWCCWSGLLCIIKPTRLCCAMEHDNAKCIGLDCWLHWIQSDLFSYQHPQWKGWLKEQSLCGHNIYQIINHDCREDSVDVKLFAHPNCVNCELIARFIFSMLSVCDKQVLYSDMLLRAL